jgi:hypothetical protein
LEERDIMQGFLTVLDSVESSFKSVEGYIGINKNRFVYGNGFIYAEYIDEGNRKYNGLRGKYKIVRGFLTEKNGYELIKVKADKYVFKNNDFGYVVDYIIDEKIKIDEINVEIEQGETVKLKDLIIENDDLFMQRIIKAQLDSNIILAFNRIVYDGKWVRAIMTDRYMWVKKKNSGEKIILLPVYVYGIVKSIQNIYGDGEVIITENGVCIKIENNITIMCGTDYVLSVGGVMGVISEVTNNVKSKNYITVFDEGLLKGKFRGMLEKIKEYVEEISFKSEGEERDGVIMLIGRNKIDGINVRKKIKIDNKIKEVINESSFRVEDLLMAVDNGLIIQVSDDKSLIRYIGEGVEYGVVSTVNKV